MRKFQRVAVVAAMLGSVGFLGAGISQAHGDEDGKFKADNKQNQKCSADYTGFTGTSAGNDILTPSNVSGLQLTDKSEHTSVECTQIWAIGH
ncbi:hypothetical protein ACFY0F_00460 [Streptomyces sp. NPDC001544]|uniref:hypothetical protein n=1 Tax=Streptomyces sp. NPDC001544 TaxID=3364584 RepID=UPI0036A71185